MGASRRGAASALIRRLGPGDEALLDASVLADARVQSSPVPFAWREISAFIRRPLFTGRDNIAAQRAYEKIGFRPIGERQRTIRKVDMNHETLNVE